MLQQRSIPAGCYRGALGYDWVGVRQHQHRAVTVNRAGEQPMCINVTCRANGGLPFSAATAHASTQGAQQPSGDYITRGIVAISQHDNPWLGVVS